MRGKAPDRDRLSKPRQRGIEVRDGALKLQFFYQWHAGIGTGPNHICCVHKFVFRSRKQTAERLGLTDAQLEGVADGGASEPRRYSEETLRVLGEELGFDAFSEEFLNSAALDFAKAYNAANRCKPEYTLKPARSQERRTGARLARGQRAEPKRSECAGLASIEIDGHQFGPGTVSIEIVISCGAPILAGFETSIESAQMELHCGDAGMTRESYLSWLGNSARRVANGRGEPVAIGFGGGDRARPIWKFRAEKGGIGTLALEPGFVDLDGLAPGDEVEVRLGTWLMDVGETDPIDETLPVYTADGFAILGPDGARLAATPKAVSILKRRVAGVLRKTLLPDDNGYVNVASHVLRVVEAESHE